MTITLNFNFTKTTREKQGIVRREFLIGGVLSIDRIIEEKAPSYSKKTMIVRYIMLRRHD